LKAAPALVGRIAPETITLPLSPKIRLSRGSRAERQETTPSQLRGRRWLLRL